MAMNNLEGILHRIRQGTTTVEDAETVWALIVTRDERIRNLEAANRLLADQLAKVPKAEGL
jgi:hypothetical protein